jgi:Ca-activated chloride channel family protein
MKSAFQLALCSGILFFAAAVSPHAQVPSGTAAPKFRSSVDIVTIQASVHDTRGRPVSGLRSEDFEVWDNGQLKRLIDLRSDRQAPVSLAILVDVSGSMRLAASRDMARLAYESILGQLREGRDEVALFTFDSALDTRRHFTKNVASLRGALDQFEPYGTTALYDATAAAAKHLAARSGARKAVIILTDGIDTASKLTPAQVSGIASSIDVPVSILATVSSEDERAAMERLRRSSESQAADLRDLADWSGGELLFASTPDQIAPTVSRVIAELRQQYVLAIEAAHAREWRRLSIRVKGRSASVKARGWYFGG